MNIFSQRLIAETACGHNGNIKILKKLINIAKNCGVKTIKFQIFNINERAIPGTKEWSIFSKLELKEEEWKVAINYAKNQNRISSFSKVAKLISGLKNPPFIFSLIFQFTMIFFEISIFV